MKDKIKEILRDNLVNKNSLNVEVSRPSQVLIIMRGVSGAGKSTKAKTIMGNGVIHSTDAVIEGYGDYREFFNKMITNNDFGGLRKAHSTNLNNAVESMKSGITPIIIDNTNIKQNESKSYIVEALKMGYDDNNINFVDVGTNGMDAETLAKRNTHGVSLDKINSMISSYTSQGPLTLKSVLESKDFYKNSDVLYSAVVLDDISRDKLLDRVKNTIPYGWKIIAHHMTIAFKKGVKNKEDIGKEIVLTVTELGVSDMAIAVRVSGYETTNQIPHITVGINPDGGNPVMSNNINKWIPINPFNINGVVTEIKK
jgi:predicted kinase